ncbi:hypothetical protein [Eleftheria terrae]|nr:hypothetical protein [Eleftheria terrae]WKB53543.1 hypothetical protein N7L95_03850 [Eleftheria terrae]
MTSPGILMWALRQGKRLEPNGSATYFVEILNEGPQAGYHNLEGGTFA